MPRVPAFKIEAIADLFAQLRFAPTETRGRELAAIEALISEIEPEQRYPSDFIVFRITGYRPDAVEVGETILGAELLGELTSFILRISHDLDLPHDQNGRQAISLAEVERKLNVSRKTMQRYRRQGLVCHYVVFEDGEKRLACFDDALARFQRAHDARLERAAGFTRLAPEIEAAIIAKARELRESRQISLHGAARRLAEQHERSLETIRQILRRHDARAREPIFDGRGPLQPRDGRLAYRAQRLGVPVSAIARRFGKTISTVHRAINRHRADILRTMPLTPVPLPTFELDDAADVILSAPAVIEQPGQALATTDALDLIEQAKSTEAINPTATEAMLAAWHFLRWRAGRGIDALDISPGAAELDAIETDLRFASIIKRRMVYHGFPTAILVIERFMYRELTTQPGELIVAMIAMARDVLSGEIDRINPARQNFERICGQAMDRSLAALPAGRWETRAAARHARGTVLIDDPFDALCPWDHWLRLRPDWRLVLNQLDHTHRELIELRYGLNTQLAHTRAAVAAILNVSPRVLGTRERTAMRRLRALRIATE